MSLPLHTHAVISGVRGVQILKVLDPEELGCSPYNQADVLVWQETGDGPALRSAAEDAVRVEGLRNAAVVQSGDVVRLREGASTVSVLYRRGVRSNSLFTTERCNSRCLMCSQPPRDIDDAWRVPELLRLIPLIDKDTSHLTITGGEPTLLGAGLSAVLDSCQVHLPETSIQVLTNGRTFSDRALTERLVRSDHSRTTWAVPLYADVASVHDEVVAVDGAFVETLQGLFELGRLGARVEIRIVLHKLSIPRLQELAAFIYRRLPFAAHVALMGLEPMGFTKGHRDKLWIDPIDYQCELSGAVFHLANRGLPVSIYNLPLCVLDRPLWPFARQSISDWKNTFPSDCEPCALRPHCSGFFASAGRDWRSRSLRPLTLKELAA